MSFKQIPLWAREWPPFADMIYGRLGHTCKRIGGFMWGFMWGVITHPSLGEIACAIRSHLGRAVALTTIFYSIMLPPAK